MPSCFFPPILVPLSLAFQPTHFRVYRVGTQRSLARAFRVGKADCLLGRSCIGIALSIACQPPSSLLSPTAGGRIDNSRHPRIP